MASQRDSIKLRQIERKLQSFAGLKASPPPRKGWISELRRALGMSASQLAERMHVSRPAVSQYEKGEVAGTITMDTLRRAAVALDCQLVYALVPNTSLQEMLRHQATIQARRIVQRMAHSMRLEKQGVPQREIERQIEDLVDQLLTDRPRSLWNVTDD